MRHQKRVPTYSSSSSSNSNNRYDLPTVSNDSEHNQHITTQLLEQILLSSQDGDNSKLFSQHSTFTQKFKKRTHVGSIDDRVQHKQPFEGVEMMHVEAIQGGTVVTTMPSQRSHVPGGTHSQTGKNWRHLVTPAHDSFKKLEKSRRPGVQYSNTQQPNAQDDRSTSIQGSNDIINHNADQLSRQRPLIFTSGHTHSHSLEEMISAPISLKNVQEDYCDQISHSQMSVNEFNTPNITNADFKTNNQLSVHITECNDDENSYRQQSQSSKRSQMMHSMLKSYQKISNADFYDNLHRKYFNKAKVGGKGQNSQLKEINDAAVLEGQSSKIDETGLFDLTEQSNPALLGASKSTVMNHTSHRDKTSHINFKNSIFTKLNPSSINDTSGFIDNSQMLANQHMVFSQQSNSMEISKLQRKDLSHLSRRDLSRMDEASELLSQGESRILSDEKGHSQLAKISVLQKQKQTSEHDDYFFSQVTQARNLKYALDGQPQNSTQFQKEDDQKSALTLFYKQLVKLERQKLQSKSTLIQNSADRNFETVPLPSSANHQFGSLRESALIRDSSSKLSNGEGVQSDFTFVLSNPTTEQHNSRIQTQNPTTTKQTSAHSKDQCHEPLNLSILQQSQDQARPQRKQGGQSLPNGGGTASFPNGFAVKSNHDSNSSAQQSFLQFNSGKMSESRIYSANQQPRSDSIVNSSSFISNNVGSRLGQLNLGEIAASPIQNGPDDSNAIAFSRYHDNTINQDQLPYSIQEEENSGEQDIDLLEIMQVACENIELTLKEGLTAETQERLLRLLIMAQQIGIYQSQLVNNYQDQSINERDDHQDIVDQSSQSIMADSYPTNPLISNAALAQSLLNYNSLISTANQIQKSVSKKQQPALDDTQYSYFDQESIHPRPLQEKQEQGTMTQTQTHQILKSLMDTKQQLKKEQTKTIAQADQLSMLQSQVNLLNQKWALTENHLKSIQSQSIVDYAQGDMRSTQEKQIIQFYCFNQKD